MFEFTKMIREIDAELKPEFQAGAFAWADQNMSGAHARAVERFEHATQACTERCDWVSLEKEGGIYKDGILKILRAYKASRQIDDQASFLESLRPA
jgi:hypothetical protein